uniref:AlNc14C18G1919 protein n=1 Tax=Albugo laibachii Nc14 TaxID=890382 RepID=F0W4U9_9STRA|nr:AlNc14C18G1919 [Albugo laibachii Nc14]CCA25098.1 AlNc14C275G10025 [Albugo laibachii Nc14]|eukprot:CCA25098.1 AlNc14C275G10025 [Albugo laibachii Nc14]
MRLDAEKESHEGLDQQLKCLKYELELLNDTSDQISQLLAVLTEEQRQLVYAKKRLQSSVKTGQQTTSTRLDRLREEQNIRMQIAQEKHKLKTQDVEELRGPQLQVRLETNENENDVSGLLEQEFEL